MIAAFELLDYARGPALIGDTGYDSNEFRADINARGMKPVIQLKAGTETKDAARPHAVRPRYLVEVFFHNLKRFRAIATRFEKTRTSYLALLHVACIWLWLN